ncbi:beta-lactamase family protein [Setomelanomma holmii]|uniref:Beta-lactamase family protein n=1 Tax=Setomelanomma holmii TaxID=210430 RepID=A0A9P4HIK4_9PLEO|nr:beta-lactamase family protein [Setomelanomma holmii]
MAPALSSAAAASLRTYINNSTITVSPLLPGALVYITDSQNNVLFSYGVGTPTPPTAQSISIIQSLTKLVGSIACLQLVERGLTSLDDPTIILTHLPELAAKKVLTGYTTSPSGTKHFHFEDQHVSITPRMLLNHTYGGGHTYFNTLLFQYFQDRGIWHTTNEAADTYATLLASPLLWQPGTKTNYGQGLDWIAVLIERLTGQKLAEYLEENIFKPLGMSATGFEPGFGGDVLEREGNEGMFWPRVLRDGNGTDEGEGESGGFTKLDPDVPEIKTRDDAFPAGNYHTGSLGTGLVSCAKDSTRLLSILLPQNAGRDPVTGRRMLSPKSVAEITSAQLPEHIRCDSRNVPASGASSIILPGLLEAAHIDPHGSFGLGCGVQGADRVLKNGQRGRSKRSVYWYGAANTECWVDGEKGIVVFVNGNFYPWNDENWLGFVAGVEGQVYKELQE